MVNKVRAIAFYLPQFYPTSENDEWWEPGFTEWTNVARAKPLFPGHNQPRIPRDLGFYDLRVPETREKQAQLAREAGIEGFCYWHYWFGDGKRLLSEVFKEVVETGKPNYPFCLCWANHSWYAKTWDPNKPNKLLIEQTYKGVEDYTAHFNEMLLAFKDDRYIKVDGKLVFGIFDADMFPDIKLFIDTWNNLARDNGLKGFYFFGFAQGNKRYKKTMSMGFDTVVYDCLGDVALKHLEGRTLLSKIFMKLRKNGYLHATNYEDYVSGAINIFNSNKECTPCINPDFDHSPRSSDKGIILHQSTPAKWKKLLKASLDIVSQKENTNNLLFIKAWNEWAEGNYLEPDSKFGKQYIEETAKVLNRIKTNY